ncbi:sec-independent translocase [Streptomyces radiopugnans]|uniref:Sec-independent protein translocase protein TatB n=1 Tax=Streptomyces radiopugnans TaxID=403935 RepID=A0A1H9HIZ8_9ACTN|nr:sec-independent translocase [Streptomyces radiopugnans]URN13137.1 sec-independent translocase [Streptomyces radiopugnans]SEQ62275.1 sec-independent protein translocase protein TatB [Streptomyces radiopugnans]
MFFDIGPLELIALVILAILVFGPEKLPKVIQDTARFIRKVREFSDSARDDIRRELGPEFKDFDFEDLNPKNFARKHLLENEDLGLKEIRNGFDLRQELAEVTDAVNGREIAPGGSAASGTGTAAPSPGGSGVDLHKPGQAPRTDPPPYDADAT